MGSLRIFIACAEEKLRLALLFLLDQSPELVVAGLADRYSGLLTQLEGAQPEVLLLDWELSTEPMIDLLKDIHNLEHQPKVIVFSTNPQKKEAVLAAGADFFICKDAPPDLLLPMLNEIRQSKTDKQTMDE